MRNYLIIINILICFLVANSAVASDDAREKKWADEIVPQLVVGDAVKLKTRDGPEFLALYTEAKNPKAAVVLAHGMGVHPDWGIVGALRVSLADAGYSTLAIQMPILAADAKADDYPATFAEAGERLNAASTWLRDKAQRKIILVSHSMGARMANAYMENISPNLYSSWVSIGITAPYKGIAKITLPILDVYGENDFANVLSDAPARAHAIAKNDHSKQIKVKAADHYFNGKEAELAKVIGEFLEARYGK